MGSKVTTIGLVSNCQGGLVLNFVSTHFTKNPSGFFGGWQEQAITYHATC